MPAIDTFEFRKRVHCCYSVPRLIPSEIAYNAIAVAATLGIQFTPWVKGAYWTEDLTGAMEKARDTGAEFILTVDYDTPHTPDDVLRLCALMQHYDRADAIAALQMRRNSIDILASKRDDKGDIVATVPAYAFSDELVRVASAHFGLTLIRVSALKRMPKPWFMSVPDARGEWHDGHIPADMNFWRMFESVGNSLFVAMKAPVAHMEWQRTWVGPDFKPLYQSEADFAANGVPACIRDGIAWVKK